MRTSQGIIILCLLISGTFAMNGVEFLTNSIASTIALQCLKAHNYDFAYIPIWIDDTANTEFDISYNDAVYANMSVVEATATLCQTSQPDSSSVGQAIYAALPIGFAGRVWFVLDSEPSCWSSNTTDNLLYFEDVIFTVYKQGASVGVMTNSEDFAAVFGDSQATMSVLPLWYVNTAEQPAASLELFGGWKSFEGMTFMANVEICGVKVNLDTTDLGSNPVFNLGNDTKDSNSTNSGNSSNSGNSQPSFPKGGNGKKGGKNGNTGSGKQGKNGNGENSNSFQSQSQSEHSNTFFNTHDNTNDNTLDNTFDNTRDNTYGNTHDNTHDNTDDNTFDNKFDNQFDNTHDNTDDNTHDNTDDNTYDNTHDNTHDNTDNNTYNDSDDEPTQSQGGEPVGGYTGGYTVGGDDGTWTGGDDDGGWTDGDDGGDTGGGDDE